MWVCIFPEDKTHQKNLKNEVVIFFRYRYKQVSRQCNEPQKPTNNPKK
jgi:hypothetical protein